MIHRLDSIYQGHTFDMMREELHWKIVIFCIKLWWWGVFEVVEIIDIE